MKNFQQHMWELDPNTVIAESIRHTDEGVRTYSLKPALSFSPKKGDLVLTRYVARDCQWLNSKPIELDGVHGTYFSGHGNKYTVCQVKEILEGNAGGVFYKVSIKVFGKEMLGYCYQWQMLPLKRRE